MALSEFARKKELAKELDSYIASRRDDEPVRPVKVVKQVEEEPVEVPTDVENMEEAPKKGWFSSMMDKIFGPEEEFEGMETPGPTAAVIPEENVHSDMREIALISLMVVKQLPSRTLEEFKESRDFVRFKEILKKHQIIK